jgi:hypothetical protein
VPDLKNIWNRRRVTVPMLMVLTVSTLGVQWFGLTKGLYLRYVHKDREKDTS